MIRGSCLCGAVRYEVEGPFVEAHHCHCGMCRKQHGAAFATYAACKERTLKIEGEEQVSVFASTPAVKRKFCRTCGSSLFFTHEAAPKLVWVAMGTMDDGGAAAGELPVPDANCFASSKARWWTISDALPAHDGQRPELAGG